MLEKENLFETKTRFSLAIKANKLGIYDYDLTSGTIQLDKRVREILGVGPKGKFTHDTFMSLIHPDDRANTQAEIDKALNPNENGEYCAEYRVINQKDGNMRWITATGQTFFEHNHPVRLIVTVQDITERKKAEDAIRENQELYHKLIDNTQDAFVLFELLYNKESKLVDLVYLRVNEAYEKQTGVKSSVLVGKRVKGIFPKIESHWFSSIDKANKTGISEHFENYNQVTSRWYDGYTFKYQEGKIGILFRDVTELKKAENSLRDSEQLYRTLFDNSDDGFILLEPLYNQAGELCDFRFLKVNPAFERQTGGGIEDVEGKRASEVPENIEPIWFSLIGKVAKTGEWARYERFNKEVSRWFDVHMFPFVRGQVGVLLKDISERKKAEAELKESESKYQQMVDKLPEMVFEIDNKGIINFANSKSIEQTGYSKQDFGSSFNANRLVAEEDAKRSKTNMIKMFSDGKRQSIEYMFVRKNGSKFPVLLISVPIIKQDKIVGARGISVDMTELKQARLALQESEKRYHQLFDSMSEMFFIADLVFDKAGKIIDYVITDANVAFLKLLNKRKEDIIGKGTRDVFKDINLRDLTKFRVDYWLEMFNQVEKTGKPIRSLMKSEVLNRYFEVLAWRPNPNQMGLIAEDVTERKNLEKQLQEKERLSAIGETAGMVGHDLRNPLQAIIGELYLAKSELDSVPEGQSRTMMLESIEDIEAQINYMDKIVSDLQTFVKPVETIKQIINLNELLASTLDQLNIPENIQATIKLREKLTVDVDPQLLRRVLINLVTNSVQAMPNGGELMIEALVDGKGQMEIKVEDTGVGIAEEVKPKIFTPLFTTKSRGQGFGLSVCKRVIEAQGGTIFFESEVGKGTKFTINLPSNSQ